MYRPFYDTLRPNKLFNKVELLGGDTDSFFLALHTNADIGHQDIFRNLRSCLDSSNYPQDHPLYSLANKARLGCFKDETGGQAIAEMILLKPKMYSFKVEGSRGIKRAKGISKSVVSRLDHDRYRDIFRELKENTVTMTILRSRRHTVQTVTFQKRALSAWEDKRCWLDHNTSLPHGHYASGVPPPKRRRLAVPPSGDVE